MAKIALLVTVGLVVLATCIEGKRWSPRYGRWCGAGHGGLDTILRKCSCQRSEYRTVQQCRNNHRPIDEVDAACIPHDVCVGCRKVPRKSRLHWCPCQHACERDLVRRMRGASCARTWWKNGNAKRKCLLFRRAAIVVFTRLPCWCNKCRWVKIWKRVWRVTRVLRRRRWFRRWVRKLVRRRIAVYRRVCKPRRVLNYRFC